MNATSSSENRSASAMDRGSNRGDSAAAVRSTPRSRSFRFVPTTLAAVLLATLAAAQTDRAGSRPASRPATPTPVGHCAAERPYIVVVGRAVDCWERPVPGAAVRLVLLAKGVTINEGTSADSEGRFRIAAANSGYEVREGRVSLGHPGVKADAAFRVWPVKLPQKAGETVDVGDLAVAEARALTLRVVDQDGEPVAHAGLFAGSEHSPVYGRTNPSGESRLVVPYGPTAVRVALWDVEQTTVDIGADAPESMTVRVQRTAAAVAARQRIAARRGAQPAAAAGDERRGANPPHDDEPPGSFVISGRVVDARGEPVADAEVGFRYGGERWSVGRLAFTDSEGRFRKAIPPLDVPLTFFRVTVSPARRTAVGPCAVIELDVSAGFYEPLDLGDVRSEAGRRLRVAVVDESGAFVQHSDITATGAAPVHQPLGPVSGRRMDLVLPPNAVQVRFNALGFEPTDIEIPADAADGFKVVVRRSPAPTKSPR